MTERAALKASVGASGRGVTWSQLSQGADDQAALSPENRVAVAEGPVVVVMGVSGSGKSTVGAALAKHLGYAFLEGDNFHPPANIRKLSAGMPLTEADRAPWLRSIATSIGGMGDRGTVVSCSALRRCHRDTLRSCDRSMLFLHLIGPKELIATRLSAREHFMPSHLLDSQIETLEGLWPDEDGVAVSLEKPPGRIIEEFLATRFARYLSPGATY